MIDIEALEGFGRWRLELTPTGTIECRLYQKNDWAPYAWGSGDTIELAIKRALGCARVREGSK
jgi:hypothetical protein